MEDFKNYLESSTLHGLVYISTTRRLIKLFWILVVIAGFLGAGIMIQQSFQSWQDSPVKTTIETRPISEMTFPKISVCPPRDTYTNLNYDLMNINNTTPFDENVSFDLIDNFIHHFQQLDYKKYLLERENSFQEENKYRNWYMGMSSITQRKR